MDKPQPKRHSIRMGEMTVATNGEELRTLLGSCVGLALYDRRLKLGGLAHIVLPEANGQTDRPGKFADTAIPALISQMRQVAVAPMRLTATIAGGASMLVPKVSRRIGTENVEACRRILDELKIPIAAQHCGGQKGGG